MISLNSTGTSGSVHSVVDGIVLIWSATALAFELFATKSVKNVLEMASQHKSITTFELAIPVMSLKSGRVVPHCSRSSKLSLKWFI